MRFITLSLISL